MHKFKPQSSRSALTLFFILMFICAVFSVISIIMIESAQNFVENGVQTQATITQIDRIYDTSSKDYDYSVFVQYEVDGTKYEGQLNYYHSGMSVGDETSIYYMPDNPSQMQSAEGIFIYYIFLGTAVLMFGTAIFILARLVKKNQLEKRVLKNGESLIAIVASIDFDPSRKSNNMYSRFFVCLDENEKAYKSQLLSYSGHVHVGEFVKISVDPKNQNQCVVDMKELGKRKNAQLETGNVVSLYDFSKTVAYTGQNLQKLEELAQQITTSGPPSHFLSHYGSASSSTVQFQESDSSRFV